MATLTPQSRAAGRRRRGSSEPDSDAGDAGLDRAPLDPDDAFARYGAARLENRASAHAAKHGLDASALKRPGTSKEAFIRAKKELHALGRADEAELVDWAVRNHAGLLVEALATAGADMKRFVRQTWSYFLQGCRERRPETSTEADLLMARARLRASAEATFIAIARVGITGPSVTKSTTLDNGTRVTVKAPSGMELAARMGAFDEGAMRVELNLDAVQGARPAVAQADALAEAADRLRLYQEQRALELAAAPVEPEVLEPEPASGSVMHAVPEAHEHTSRPERPDDEVPHAWLPPTLARWSDELDDLAKLVGEPRTFKAALIARCEALTRTGRAGPDLLEAARAWLDGGQA